LRASISCCNAVDDRVAVVVFAAHNHAFLFLVGSLVTILSGGWAVGALAAWMFVYLARSTRVVYEAPWLGIGARAMVLGFAYLMLSHSLRSGSSMRRFCCVDLFAAQGLRGDRPACLNCSRIS